MAKKDEKDIHINQINGCISTLIRINEMDNLLFSDVKKEISLLDNKIMPIEKITESSDVKFKIQDYTEKKNKLLNKFKEIEINNIDSEFDMLIDNDSNQNTEDLKKTKLKINELIKKLEEIQYDDSKVQTTFNHFKERIKLIEDQIQTISNKKETIVTIFKNTTKAHNFSEYEIGISRIEDVNAINNEELLTIKKDYLDKLKAELNLLQKKNFNEIKTKLTEIRTSIEQFNSKGNYVINNFKQSIYEQLKEQEAATIEKISTNIQSEILNEISSIQNLLVQNCGPDLNKQNTITNNSSPSTTVNNVTYNKEKEFDDKLFKELELEIKKMQKLNTQKTISDQDFSELKSVKYFKFINAENIEFKKKISELKNLRKNIQRKRKEVVIESDIEEIKNKFNIINNQIKQITKIKQFDQIQEDNKNLQEEIDNYLDTFLKSNYKLNSFLLKDMLYKLKIQVNNIPKMKDDLTNSKKKNHNLRDNHKTKHNLNKTDEDSFQKIEKQIPERKINRNFNVKKLNEKFNNNIATETKKQQIPTVKLDNNSTHSTELNKSGKNDTHKKHDIIEKSDKTQEKSLQQVEEQILEKRVNSDFNKNVKNQIKISNNNIATGTEKQQIPGTDKMDNYTHSTALNNSDKNNTIKKHVSVDNKNQIVKNNNNEIVNSNNTRPHQHYEENNTSSIVLNQNINKPITNGNNDTSDIEKENDKTITNKKSEEKNREREPINNNSNQSEGAQQTNSSSENNTNNSNEDVKVVTLEKYFTFNPKNLTEEFGSIEYMDKILQEAKTYENKVNSFAGTNSSIKYFILDENLMQLMEYIDKVKYTKGETDKKKKKISVLKYIEDLQEKLDENIIDE